MNKFFSEVAPVGLSGPRSRTSAIDPTSMPVVIPNSVTSCQKAVERESRPHDDLAADHRRVVRNRLGAEVGMRRGAVEDV